MNAGLIHRVLRGAAIALGVVAVGVIGARVGWEARARAPAAIVPAALPDLGALPEFRLVDRSGAPFGSADLGGKVWVAGFIFTRCGGPCPRVTASMARLQAEFEDAPDFRLVSFTVDPDYDTPAVLAGYADRAGADPARWRFLTGDPAAVKRVVRESFRLMMEKSAAGAPPGEAVRHSMSLALVDRAGRLRGYYAGDDAAALARLRRDLHRLL